MQHVAIFGVGLIGGSFALALRRAGFRGRITGVSSPRTIDAALSAGVIDDAMEPAAAARTCDLIYLSQPISGILKTLQHYGAEFREDAVVTDAGSTKALIVTTAAAHVGRAKFIGGHPMAGKERRGVEESDAFLFVNRKYVLTPLLPQDAATPQFQTLSAWIERIGAETIVLDAATHDLLVAYTSHLPQLLSTALASLLSEVQGTERVAGPAALEMTRLAASPFDIWHDILKTNIANVEAALTQLASRLQNMKAHLNSPALADEFERASAAARKLRSKEIR